ncbi:adenosylcobinamide-GDP ribazoletransferase [Thalassotalea fusca]
MTISRTAALKQWQLFQLAVMFFTRIPVGRNVPYSAQRLNQSSRYFALVGVVVAIVFILSYQLALTVWPNDVAMLLAMIASFLVTGGFHEDGLADAADGIGGGMTVDKRLSIMKDSRIGTYGVLALFSVVLLKYQLLLALSVATQLTWGFIASVVIAHCLSRAIAGSLIFNTAYVTKQDASKSKPLAEQQSKTELVILLATGLLPLTLFIFNGNFWSLIATLLAVLIVFRTFARRWLINKIGGITGDCLGAVQQIAELIIYFVLLALINN